MFLGIQPAVIALIVRACHRIGAHCLTDWPLWGIAAAAAAGELLGVSFYLTLPLAGASYLAAAQGRHAWLGAAALAYAVALWQLSPVVAGKEAVLAAPPAATAAARPAEPVAPAVLFGSGLRAGLLTFGGAYTAIPFLKEDAVERGRWMGERDFLDGVALSGVLPAPLIIFSTFVGYFGGGALGALAMTAGVFLPAFGFSLLFFRHLEAVIANVRLRHFLEGVAAGVVGLIVVTAVSLARAALGSVGAWAIFGAALAALYFWRSKFAVPGVILAAGSAGAVFF